MLIILKQCKKEIAKFPEEIRGDLADAIARLEEGHLLTMPLSRPMPTIGKGVHELRLRDTSGIYRVIYAFHEGGKIYLVYAFKKTSQQTAKEDIETAKRRLREVLR